jgi:hypothetical protein
MHIQHPALPAIGTPSGFIQLEHVGAKKIGNFACKPHDARRAIFL